MKFLEINDEFTKMNEHLDITTFVHTLIYIVVTIYSYLLIWCFDYKVFKVNSEKINYPLGAKDLNI